jgi:hypothetical protein
MTEPWDELEAMMRAMRLEPLSARLRQEILARLAPAPATLPARRPHYGRWLVATAAAAILAALGIWHVGHSAHGPRPVAGPPVKEGNRPAVRPKESIARAPAAIALAAGWHVEPTGNAVYAVTRPDRISLRHGELLVESRPLAGGERNTVPALGIETPAGTVQGRRHEVLRWEPFVAS